MKKFAMMSLMAVLALGACDDDDDPTGNTGTATVRVVNATTGTTYASINAFNGNTSVGAGIGQGTGAACGSTFTVPAGNRRIRVINASTNATNADIYLRPSTETTAPTGAATVSNVATGTAGTAGGSMYINVPTANNAVRIYNTGTTATPRYDAYSISTTNFPASGNTTLIFTDTGVYQINNCT